MQVLEEGMRGGHAGPSNEHCGQALFQGGADVASGWVSENLLGAFQDVWSGFGGSQSAAGSGKEPNNRRAPGSDVSRAATDDMKGGAGPGPTAPGVEEAGSDPHVSGAPWTGEAKQVG